VAAISARVLNIDLDPIFGTVEGIVDSQQKGHTTGMLQAL
jgi:hypothetical protein